MTRADYASVVATLDEAAELCRATGLREDEELCLACLAKILAKQREWDKALELARDVLAADWPPTIRWGALWAQASSWSRADGQPRADHCSRS
jgi:hypothetical protein